MKYAGCATIMDLLQALPLELSEPLRKIETAAITALVPD
jgi:hypothetical protein